MSSSSSASGFKPGEHKQGFTAEDIETFQRKGNTLSRKSTGNIASERPGVKRRDTDSGVTTGFMGKFSGMSPEQLDRLTNSFLQRQSNIKQRTAQPGRSGFLIQR